MHNGHVLTEDELAVTDPADTEVCSRCGQIYYTTAHRADTCWGCWYAGAMEEAEASFLPLSASVTEHLGVRPSVWQTGGMVMCLSIPLGGKTYALLSEAGEFDCASVGVYRDPEGDEDTEEDTVDVAFLRNEELPTPDGATTWASVPDYSKAVGEWVSGALRPYLAEEDTAPA